MSRSNTRTSALLIVIVTSLACAAAPARGAWPPSGLPVATGPAWQFRPVGLTGPGGELHAFWVELAPTTYALHAQHLTLQSAYRTVVPIDRRTHRPPQDGIGGGR